MCISFVTEFLAGLLILINVNCQRALHRLILIFTTEGVPNDRLGFFQKEPIQRAWRPCPCVPGPENLKFGKEEHSQDTIFVGLHTQFENKIVDAMKVWTPNPPSRKQRFRKCYSLNYILPCRTLYSAIGRQDYKIGVGPMCKGDPEASGHTPSSSYMPHTDYCRS